LAAIFLKMSASDAPRSGLLSLSIVFFCFLYYSFWVLATVGGNFWMWWR